MPATASAVDVQATKALPVQEFHRIDLIGCGGTGAILAEHLARWIVGIPLNCRLVLWDGDVVEQENLVRQQFSPWELGRNKAEALATRLSGQLGIAVSFMPHRFVGSSSMSARAELMITCTDTILSRKAVATSVTTSRYTRACWLDVGNELQTGQAVLGTTHDPDLLGKEWVLWDDTPYIQSLPDMAAITPEILRKRSEPPTAGCAVRPFLHQGPAVNLAAAMAAAMIARQVLIDRTVRTAQVWFDVAAGRMLPVPITRELFGPWKTKRTKPKPRKESRT